LVTVGFLLPRRRHFPFVGLVDPVGRRASRNSRRFGVQRQQRVEDRRIATTQTAGRRDAE
jgi:hypothetical protein